MRERELTVRRRRAVVFGIVVLVVAVGLFHLVASPTSSPLPPPAPEERPQEPPPATGQDTVSAAHVDAVAPATPTVADLTFLCGELLNPVDGGYPSADDAADDCQSALNARFSSATTAKALVAA